jgi:hypothetical protein
LQRVSPEAHVRGVVPHAAEVHVATVPGGDGQTVPQTPQLAGSLDLSVHLLPHFASGSVQVAVHPVGPQTGVPPEHDVPQAPHVAALARSASQPFAGLPSQSAHPALQLTISQAPCALHCAVPLIEQASALQVGQIVPAG